MQLFKVEKMTPITAAADKKNQACLFTVLCSPQTVVQIGQFL